MDSQGAEFGHVVEAGHGDAADVVVVERAAAQGRRVRLDSATAAQPFCLGGIVLVTLTEPPVISEPGTLPPQCS